MFLIRAVSPSPFYSGGMESGSHWSGWLSCGCAATGTDAGGGMWHSPLETKELSWNNHLSWNKLGIIYKDLLHNGIGLPTDADSSSERPCVHVPGVFWVLDLYLNLSVAPFA